MYITDIKTLKREEELGELWKGYKNKWYLSVFLKDAQEFATLGKELLWWGGSGGVWSLLRKILLSHYCLFQHCVRWIHYAHTTPLSPSDRSQNCSLNTGVQMDHRDSLSWWRLGWGGVNLVFSLLPANWGNNYSAISFFCLLATEGY